MKRHQRQDVDRDAARHEQLEELQAVAPEAVDDHREEDEQRERHRDDDVARDREGVGDDADDVEHQDEHEQREHQREEPHALAAGAAAQHVGDEFVGHLGDRLQAAGHQRARAGRADHQQGDHAERDQHVERRIGKRDLGVADLADREEVDDLELVDRIHGWIKVLRGYAAHISRRARDPIHCFEPGGSSVFGGITPATRITLRTPAANPRSRNTIMPHGEIPSHRSISQPMAAPTRTPATSSADKRKPRAIADGSAVAR